MVLRGTSPFPFQDGFGYEIGGPGTYRVLFNLHMTKEFLLGIIQSFYKRVKTWQYHGFQYFFFALKYAGFLALNPRNISFHAPVSMSRKFFRTQAALQGWSTKGSGSLEYCIISIPGNQKCLLLYLMKEGKTFDLEFQANLAIFVF